MSTTDDPTERTGLTRRSLTETLARARPDADAHELARTVLWYESAGREFVGLAAACSEALYYHTASETLVAVSFDERTIHRDANSFRARLRNVGSWVSLHRSELDWVHPRYRPI